MLTGPAIPKSTLRTLVERFYSRIRQDEVLGPIFNQAIGDHWPEHLDTLTAFWSSVLLGSGRYKGNPMAVHLQIPPLGRAHLERWLALWQSTTAELLPPQTAQLMQRKAHFMGQRILETVAEFHPQAAQDAPLPA
jgi:hemoglobin